MTEAEYVFVCLACSSPLRGAWQVCGERCFKTLVRRRISS